MAIMLVPHYSHAVILQSEKCLFIFMEVYIMSDYQWTENQIKKAYQSRKHKQGWLNARDIRSGFPAASVRQLMKIMIDRGYGFDLFIIGDLYCV
jgi:hypothetical protein